MRLVGAAVGVVVVGLAIAIVVVGALVGWIERRMRDEEEREP